ncbi:MAG: sensor hybrid histidine kinase [Gammaproteobacteria bacterium]|nr:sensor hybrid histidine kinase [Gammaproteobacteria bacterium]
MARLKLGLERRAVLAMVLIHLLGLPVAAGVLSAVGEKSLASGFVQRVRTVARGLTDALEIPSVMGDATQTSNVLDSVILTGEGVYAELLDDGRHAVSALNRPGVNFGGVQDLQFFEHSGSTYFIVLPVDIPGHNAEVRLGFDKRPTLDSIERLRWNSVQVLIGYAALSLGLVIVFVRHLTRPLARLRSSAQQVTSGDYEQHLFAGTNIPEVQDLAADLERMRYELVGVTAKLRAEMAQRQRVESQRKELEAELRRRQRLETVGTLTAGVAHEINNSLVPILVYAKVVFDSLTATDPSREHVAAILQSARRSKEVIRKMLTFSRQLESGTLEEIDLRGPVEEVVHLFNGLAPGNVAVTQDVETACAPVIADPTLIRVLLTNLCTNALQAMQSSGGKMTVTLRECASPAGRFVGNPRGRCVELGVCDTGHGMDPVTLERIFEPFFTTRAPGEGTGLGLAMVHGIATSLGAIVLVDSSPGVGTTFRVLFPAKDREAAP